MDKFFDDSELADVFAEFNANIEKAAENATDEDDKEMEASQRRYEEIIKKNKN